ncbi:MAG: sigma-70 family RNA polymerase sigma factor [Saprospiraceae bacterium]
MTKLYTNSLKVALASNDANKFFTILYDCMAKPILSIAIGFNLERRTPFNEYDVLQEVFIKVQKKGLAYFQKFSPEHFERYLLKMAYNQCKNFLRGYDESISLNSNIEFSAVFSSRTLSYDMSIDNHDIDTLLYSLPPVQKRIIQLRLNGFLLEEISDLLQLGLSNVKYHYGKAVRHLKSSEQINELK